MSDPLISVLQAGKVLNRQDYRFIDCRFSLADTAYGRNAFSTGHIPGSVYAHLDEDLSGPIKPGETGRHPLPDVDRFRDTISGWGIHRDTRIIVYDDGPSQYAARAWWLFKWIGHPFVQVLDGGLKYWKENHLPLETKSTPYSRTDYPSVHVQPMTVDADAILSMMATNQVTLLDARAKERFTGETEPIDSVAGHIPGAKLFPWTGNNDEQGNMRSVDELRQRYEELPEDAKARELVCYCGSGVTAAHNILAFERAGITGVKLYAGSWSEWITDPDRPIATGE